MRFLAGMFFVGAHFSRELKQVLGKTVGGSGAGIRKNQMTVRTGRGLLIAYAMAHKARKDIAYLSGPRM